MPKDIGYPEKKINKKKKPELLKADVTKKVLNYLRQAGPPPAPGQSLASEAEK